MNLKRYAIIMAGGSGERFWPLSTKLEPKQLLDLTQSGRTMLQQAIDRITPIVDEVFISTSLHLKDAIAATQAVPQDHILAEPEKRNTLGALVWSMACLANRFQHQDFIASIVTADHIIQPAEAFRSNVQQATELAIETSGLITLGIPPDRPETGFGYIEKSETTRVVRFTEKPDLETAKQFVASQNYLWNSGMFFWTRTAFENELQKAQPQALEVLQKLQQNPVSNQSDFAKLPNLSIDYALLEKSSNVHVIPATFEWHDVGSWDALPRILPQDNNGNVTVGRVRLLDCSNVIAYNSDDNEELVLMGLNNVVATRHNGSIAIFPVNRSQDVRSLGQ